MSNFSVRFKALRAEQKLSQQELANILKISKSSVNMYERGEREPSLETLESIADFFHVDLDDLMGRKPLPHRSHSACWNAPAQPWDAACLTTHEHHVILAYRNQPEMQPAVDRLLGIPSESEDLMPIAAHNDNPSEEQQQLMQRDIEKLKKL